MSWLILLLGLLPLVWLFLTIDDWKRDFTTNFAATQPEATDPELRPLQTRLSPQECTAVITQWAKMQDRWDVSELIAGAANEESRIHLVRTTPLMRFKDDIHVVISKNPLKPELSTVSATSQSRLGKGDLGQNPRNLKELMRGIAPRLP